MTTEAQVEVHSLVKRTLGNEWNARDERRVRSWIDGRLESFLSTSGLPLSRRF